MDAKLLLNDYAQQDAFPIFGDATTLGLPGHMERHSPGWQDFEVAKRPIGPVRPTGPSEATVLPITLDATVDGGDGIAILEIAAEAGDETAFVQAASGIDWSRRPAADFARGVRLALAAGAHLLARNLSSHGHRLHPHHGELAKMANILAPPRVMRSSLPPDPSGRANLEWMRDHSATYQGQWVALKDGALVASAPTARELKERLSTAHDLFLTRVI
ncbi:MAG: DUF5678 domain-containing protein [Chloroflexota bacterium]|nr:DUF5678 domain-containing protein [Chloroflexota bacterium]